MKSGATKSECRLQLATIGDHDLLGGSATLAAVRLDSLDDVHTFDDSAEHDVLAVQPWGLNSGQEELATIGVWTSVGLKNVSDVLKPLY